MPSRQGETQLRVVHPLSPRQGETQVRGVLGLPLGQVERQLHGCKAARAGQPEIKLEPEIEQEPFIIRGYFGLDN